MLKQQVIILLKQPMLIVIFLAFFYSVQQPNCAGGVKQWEQALCKQTMHVSLAFAHNQQLI